MPETRSSSKQQRPTTRKSSRVLAGDGMISKLPILKNFSPKKGSSSNVCGKSKIFIDGDASMLSSSEVGLPIKKADMKSKLVALQQQLDVVQSEKMKELEAAKLQVDCIQRDLTEALRENIELKTGVTVDKSRIILNYSQLESIINCEICLLKMWAPYMLPECGHIFCVSCLKVWFSTALAEHQKAYPEFSLNPPFPAELRELSAEVRHEPSLRRQFELKVAEYNATQTIPQPAYTCPTCREIVRNKPAEVFALKNVVGTISNAMGEARPSKNFKENGKGKTSTPSQLWDGFFPADIVL